MRLAVALALVLISAAVLVEGAEAQQGGPTAGNEAALEMGFQLGINYPNPFHPDTRIPFELFDKVFEGGRPAVVTIRVFDILRQYVASPTAIGHPAGDGAVVFDLEYTAPGRYEAYWDGKNRLGSYVLSGVYILELTVNGRSQNRRIFVN